jgi:hypothetical protein
MIVLRPLRPSHPPAPLAGADVHALPHLNVVGADPQGAAGALAGIHAVVPELIQVDSIDGLYRFLTDLARTPPAYDSTLDLIGPSTGTGVVQLGATPIVASVPGVLDLFEAIGDELLPSRLRIRAVRLLGARTAMEPAGQETLRRLRQFLGVPVLGTTTLVSAAQFGPGGFERDHAAASLVDDRAAVARRPVALPADAERIRPFGFEAIGITAASELAPVPWPRFVAPRGFDLRTVTNQIRDCGQAVPGLLALPRCELLLPAGRMGGEERFRVIEVLFNWELVRVRGPDLPDGAIYPVVSSQRFAQLVNLPQYTP